MKFPRNPRHPVRMRHVMFPVSTKNLTEAACQKLEDWSYFDGLCEIAAYIVVSRDAMGKLKCFEIIFTDTKSVYYPGERVTGQCIVELKGDMKMRALRIFMRGVSKVHWTESRSTGTRLGSYTEHYNAEVEYFFKRQVLFGGGMYLSSYHIQS